MAYGTFDEGVATKKAGISAFSQLSMLLGALAVIVFLVGQNVSSVPKYEHTELIQKARQQSLAWNGFTIEMQEEADKALRLCSVGLMGDDVPCVKHVVSTDDTKFTHTEEGQNEWEETQRVLPRQASVAPLGPDIGTPGDFGDRR